MVEIAIIAGVILMLFGKTKLNDLARGLGKSTKELEKVKDEYKGLTGEEAKEEKEKEEEPAKEETTS